MHRGKGKTDKPEWHNEEMEIDPDLKAKKPLLFNTKKQDGQKAKKKLEDKKRQFADISSEFTWMKVIGQGTFGVVYKACLVNNPSRIVAIKKVYQDPKYSNREFKIVKELDHPNCIKVTCLGLYNSGHLRPLNLGNLAGSVVWSWDGLR